MLNKPLSGCVYEHSNRYNQIRTSRELVFMLIYFWRIYIQWDHSYCVYKILNLYKFSFHIIFIWQIPVKQSMIPISNSLLVCQRWREVGKKKRNEIMFSPIKDFGMIILFIVRIKYDLIMIITLKMCLHAADL